mgnify:CR=1 FL=1
MKAEKKEKYLSHLLGLTIVISFVIPHTGTALMLVSPILCVILSFMSKQKGGQTYNMFVTIALIVSLIYNLPQHISSKAISATLSFILFFFFFPYVKKIPLSNKYLYFTFIIIFISQLAYILGIPWIIRFINTYYPVSDDNFSMYQHIQSTINIDNMYDFRLGGLYRNANRCAMSLTILFAAFISSNFHKPIKKNLPFLLLCSYAIFVTGSRTGFVIGSLVLFAYIFANKQINNIWRFFVVTISIFGFIYIVSNRSDTYRSLNLSTGSAEVKFRVFEDYIKNEQDGTRFIIGYTDASRFKPSTPMMSYFDSDYGNIFYCYGLLYIFALVLFFCKMYRDMDYSGRIYLIPLLWITTAAMISSYRHSFLYLLLLSYIFITHRKPETASSSSIINQKTNAMG